MWNWYIFTVNGVTAGIPTFRSGFVVNYQLMAKEVEVHPMVTASSFFTA
jgi:hypothetical protein